MKFSTVATQFDLIEKTSSRTQITTLLADLFTQATPAEARIIAYLSMGQMYAVYIGTQFNFAEKSMYAVVAQLLDCSVEVVKTSVKKVGDIGVLLEQSEWPHVLTSTMTVNRVYKELEDFLAISGMGSQEAKQQAFVDLLKQLDVTSAKYVARIIVGKLRLGFSDMTLLDAYSWMEKGDKSLRKPLEHAYNVSADIGFIIEELKSEGIEAIERAEIVPGIPVRPAAAERLADAAAIVKKLGSCIAQPKLDGFRLQVHKWLERGKINVRFYSRNLQDMSNMFPELAAVAKKLPVDSLVVEGEAIAYDPSTDTFLPFQETAKRRRKYDVEQKSLELPLALFFFDLLFVNGESLLDETHAVRRKKLKSVLSNVAAHSPIRLIEEESITTAEQLEEYFLDNISHGLEGLVVKKPEAIYQPGKRNFNWIKLKRQETGHLDDTIDCVILGYYKGRGKRAAFGIGALLVGLLNKKTESFETVAKIGTGLTDEKWRSVRKQCDQIALSEKPREVRCAKDLYPDVWVVPKIVCLIRADEISLSPVHTAGATDAKPGYALRFPRFMGYREDKSACDATTVTEIKKLYELQFEKSRISKRSKK